MDESRQVLMKLLLELLDKKEFQETLVEELNDAIDIPFVGESKESKVFKTLIKIITKTAKKYEHVLTGEDKKED
jgi:hypothetical protein